MHRPLLASFLLLALSAPGAEAQELVGSTAPDFELANSAGGTRSLSGTTPEKNVVLVFFRGVW